MYTVIMYSSKQQKNKLQLSLYVSHTNLVFNVNSHYIVGNYFIL